MDYALDRLKGTFDAVIVPASNQGVPTAVVANITQTIPIDEDEEGRRLDESITTDTWGSGRALD